MRPDDVEDREIRGLESDLWSTFDPEKIRVAREALARRSMNAADYPRPDLAIEIDVPSPGRSPRNL